MYQLKDILISFSDHGGRFLWSFAKDTISYAQECKFICILFA